MILPVLIVLMVVVLLPRPLFWSPPKAIIAAVPVSAPVIARYRAADLDEVYQRVIALWDDFLGKVQVKTPDRALDLMLNRWLLHQTLACRIWARSGRVPEAVPCLPEHWPRAKISYRHRTARYEIAIENPQHVSGGIARLELDGVLLAVGVDSIELLDDGGAHRVQVVLGTPPSSAPQAGEGDGQKKRGQPSATTWSGCPRGSAASGPRPGCWR